MAVNKVIFGGETLVDLSEDSVTPDTLAQGVTAHDKSGAPIVGTMETGAGSVEVTTHIGTIEFYEGYGTTLEYRLLDYSNDLGLDVNSIYLAEFTILGCLQVDSGSSLNFEYHLKGVLNKGSWTQTLGYQKNTQYNLDYYGAYDSVYTRNDWVGLDEYGLYFWVGLDNIYNADMAYDYLQTKYATASFIKIG